MPVDKCDCFHAPEQHSAYHCRSGGCRCEYRQIKVAPGEWVLSRPPPKLFGREMRLSHRSKNLGECFSTWDFDCGGVHLHMTEWDEMGCIARGLFDKVPREEAEMALENVLRAAAETLTALVSS